MPSGAWLDPYLAWAKVTEFKYVGGLPGDWIPILLELQGTTAQQFAQTVHPMADIRVPSIFAMPPHGIEQATFCSALVTRQLLENVETNDLFRTQVKRFELGVPVSAPFLTPQLTASAQLGVNAPTNAVVAVIDDGLAFAHQRFRDASGATRVRYFWNQDDPQTTGSTFPFWGRELDNNAIDALVAASTHSGVVDEDALYRSAKQQLAARRRRHGTHVMDLACGIDPPKVAPTSPYIIAVQLPRSVVEDTSGAKLTPVVLEALHYILHRADDIAALENTAQLPVVVNLSYGLIAGPHDGSALLEAAIDQLIALRGPAPLRVVVPTGNAYLARCHTEFRLPKPAGPNRTIEELRWRVQPDDRAGSSMEIWLPFPTTTPPPTVDLRVTTPTGVTSPWIGPGGNWPWPSLGNVRFYANYPIAPPGSRQQIVLTVAPTAALDPALTPVAPSGTWRVEVRYNGAPIVMHAWIQRGDTPFGYPLRGRQSRFDHPDYQRFIRVGALKKPVGALNEEDIPPQSPLVRRGTISAMGTGREAVVIGGFRRSDYAASRYSGSGPIVSPPGFVGPWRVGPDVTAVADDSVALHGVLAAGTRTGSVFAMDGTSVAAPQITRLIAGLMTAGLASDRAAVQAIATTVDPAPPLPPQRGGAGRIEMPPRNPKRWTRW
jgi:hypothetical protein